MPPLDSVYPLSGTCWHSRGSAGSQNPSHCLHQSPQMACSTAEHLVTEGASEREESHQGCVPPNHLSLCPDPAAGCLALSKHSEGSKAAFKLCTRGTLVSTNSFSLIKPSFLTLAELESSREVADCRHRRLVSSVYPQSEDWPMQEPSTVPSMCCWLCSLEAAAWAVCYASPSPGLPPTPLAMSEETAGDQSPRQ